MITFVKDFFRGFVGVWSRSLNDTAYEATNCGEEYGKLFAILTTLSAAIVCLVMIMGLILLVVAP